MTLHSLRAVAHLEKTVFQDLWTVTAPVIGIKISVWDLSLIGTITLFVITVWQYYASIRMHEILRIIKMQADQAKASKRSDIINYLYHGISHYFLFTTTLPNDIYSQNFTARLVIKTLRYLPVWLPILLVLSDILTLFIPFSLSVHKGETVWGNLHQNEKIEICLRTIVEVIFIIYSYKLCSAAARYDKLTQKAIENLSSLAGC